MNTTRNAKKLSHPESVRGSGHPSRKRSAGIAATLTSPWEGSWQWLAIGALAAVALVLGYIGFWKNAASRSEEITALDTLYLALQLFVLQSGYVPGPVSWELEIARLVAPIVPAWTAVMAAAVLFRDRIQRFRRRRLRDHIVVCGLSRLGLQLARDARSAGRRVAAVEIDEGNDYIQAAAEAGCSVILGDATDPNVLAAARANRALCAMLVAGEDGINVAAAVALHDLVLRRPEKNAARVLCYVHVRDSELCNLLREHHLVAGTDRHLQLHFFNFYQDSARLLLEECPLDRESIDPDDPRTVHLVLVGLGRMGESLALEAARIGHYANRRRLRVTIVDREAAARRRAFYGHHPQFDRVCDAQFLEGEAEERDMLDQIRRWAEDEKSLTTVAVCLDGDSRAFSAALAISAQLASTRTPIWVRLSDETGLASLTSGRADGKAWRTEVHSFGRMSHACSLDMLFRGERDVLARAIHEDFVKARAQEGRPADDPSMQTWDALDETLKDSNRQQADHIAIKLRAIGCHSVPIETTESRPLVLTDSDIELMARMEHARWNAERFLGGWTPGPKDVARKTSPYLVSWEDLPENTREYDREAVRQIPRLLSLIGRRIERIPG